MKRIKRIISTITLTCFLSSAAVSDLALAQAPSGLRPNRDKLAAASIIDDIGGIQQKRMAQAEYALQMYLQTVAGNDQSLTYLSRENFVEAIDMKAETKSQPRDANMKFFFHEMPDAVIVARPPAVFHRLCVRCSLKDRYGLETFYLVFGLEKDEKGGFPVYVYTEEEAKAVYDDLKKLAAEAPRRDLKAKAAADSYIENELYDRIIAEAHRPGPYGRPRAIPAEELNIDYPGMIEAIKNELKITISNPLQLLPVEDRPCHIIPITPEIAKSIRVNPITHRAKNSTQAQVVTLSHMSNGYYNIFLTETDIGNLRRGGSAARAVKKAVEKSIVHDVGKAVGCEVLKFIAGQPFSEMDDRFNKVLLGRKDTLQPATYALRNLDILIDENGIERDYAAGEQSPAKNILRHTSKLWKKEGFILSDYEAVYNAKKDKLGYEDISRNAMRSDLKELVAEGLLMPGPKKGKADTFIMTPKFRKLIALPDSSPDLTQGPAGQIDDNHTLADATAAGSVNGLSRLLTAARRVLDHAIRTRRDAGHEDVGPAELRRLDARVAAAEKMVQAALTKKAVIEQSPQAEAFAVALAAAPSPAVPVVEPVRPEALPLPPQISPDINKGLDKFLKKYKIDPKKTFLFAMSGGDCAGPNSAYYGAVKEAAKHGYTVLGVINGFDGLGVNPDKFAQSLMIYTSKGIRIVRDMPSLIIGSSRAKFSDMITNIVSNCSHFAGVLFVGGDDHSKQAAELNDCGIPAIVLPKTIDYDFLAESMGAHIAAAEARRIVLRAHEMGREGKLIQVVELMGRDTGWITYLASKGLDDGAFTLIPEKPSYFKDVLIKALEVILEKGYLTVPMAEGYNFKDFSKKHKESGDTLFYQFLKIMPFLDKKFHSKGQFDAHGNPKLGGISEYLSLAIRYLPQLVRRIDDKLPGMAADDPNRKDYRRIIDLYRGLKERYPGSFGTDVRYDVKGEVMKNVRLSIPGYVLRGLAPDEYDSYLGETYGRYGIQLLLKGEKGLEVTVDKSRSIGTVAWLKRRKLKAVPIRDIAQKEYVAKVANIDGTEDDSRKFAFNDAEIAQSGVWWKGCDELINGKPRRPRREKIDLGGGTKDEARKLFLSTAISAATHNTSSVFGFREVEGIDSDTIALYAADQMPDEKIPAYQKYCLDETRGSTIILLSSGPSYMKDLSFEIVKCLKEEVEIRDEKRVVKKLPRGYVNLAVSDRYKLFDFSKPTPLFRRLLQLDSVLEARYKFNLYFFDKGEPGFMELLSTMTGAITYLPQLAEDDKDLKAGIDELRKKRPEIFSKDPERQGKLIIKGVRLNMPNQALGKRMPRLGPKELRQKGAWWPRGASKSVEAGAPGNIAAPDEAADKPGIDVPAAVGSAVGGIIGKGYAPSTETVPGVFDLETASDTAEPAGVVAGAPAFEDGGTIYDDGIAMMTQLAASVGKEIAPPVQNYTLFASYGLMTDEEHAWDSREYGDRFNLVRIMTNRADETVKWIIDEVENKGLNPKNVIVQLPAEFADPSRISELERLTSIGIKYMIIDTSGIAGEVKGKRVVYRRNIYAKMLLARAINEDTDVGSPIYRLLKFFVESHIDDFEGKDALIDQYMEAIKKNQIIQSVLSYKPIKRYDTEEVYEAYKGIAAALMAA